jgi:hypothetical protein
LKPAGKLAAKAAVLAVHLRAGVPFDFEAMRFTGSVSQLDLSRATSLNGTPFSWIDGVKAVNPEAYHYWHRALSITPSARLQP